MRIGVPFAASACALLALAAACSTRSESNIASEDLAGLLASRNRSEEDRLRDAGRRPVEIIEFLGVEPGMTVVDLIAAGGYFTEVLSLAVGPTGKVYAQNPAYVLEMNDGANDRVLTSRLAGGRLQNVERIDRELSDIGLPPGSIDFALTSLNFHDIYNSRGPAAAVAFLSAVHVLLRPGGVLGLIDHAGGKSAEDKQLHRIDERLVAKAAVRAGFVIEAISEVLRNPADDLTQGVFAPGLRGYTDRFAFRLRKP